jgi:SAM-dependent methyltransferase
MNDQQKRRLKAVTLAARHLLEGQVEEGTGTWKPGDLEIVLRGYGVFRDRDWLPVDRLSHLDTGQRALRSGLEEAIKAVQTEGQTSAEAAAQYLRECAYTWWNRLVALRAMEARGLMEEAIRVRDAYAGKSLRHYRFRSKHPERCEGEDEGLVAFLTECFAEVAQDLPLLFDPSSPLTLIAPSPPCLRTLVLGLSGEAVFEGLEPLDEETFKAPDLLGWVYQYWNAEEKDRVFEAASSERRKIEGRDIIPATCIYTEPYMVRFLVENSLGRLWAERHPESRLPETWTSSVRQQPDGRAAHERSVEDISFLDPACGSGHFLLVAFDLLYAMYEEEGRIREPRAICETILEKNLFGIDIDLRSVQLAALGLYLKAKEKAPDFRPRRMNLVAADVNLPADGQLERFLARHPDDRPLAEPLKKVFGALEGVTEIGSLLEIEGSFEEALRKARERDLAKAQLTAEQRQLLLFPGPPQPVQLRLPVGLESWDAWKRRTIDRLRAHFEEEAQLQDLSEALFGAQAEKGLGLIDLLSRRYDVVATNPPYMGSKNMGDRLKAYVARHYPSGKRDLFAAFILRCLCLGREGGRVAMVTQQTWLFLRSYAAMRKGILKREILETLAHLGEHGFTDTSAAGAFAVLFIMRHSPTPAGHRLWAARLIGPKSAEEKARLLVRAISGEAPKVVTTPRQADFLSLPETPIVYWLRSKFFELLAGKTLGDVADVCQGLATADDDRFVRFTWEVPPSEWAHPVRERRWAPFEKGGGYGKWFGHHWWTVDWEHDGARIKAFPNAVVRNEQHYFEEGWTYSYMARGSLGLRHLDGTTVFSHLSSAVFFGHDTSGGAATINSRFASHIVRSLSAKIQLNESYVSRIPLPKHVPEVVPSFETACLALKQWLVAGDPTERSFDPRIIESGTVEPGR